MILKTKIFVDLIFATLTLLYLSTFSLADEGNKVVENSQRASGNTDENNKSSQIPGIPTGFEKIIPEEWLSKLRELHNNTAMSFEEKRNRFEEIMSTVPPEILMKLPLAPIFEPLPMEWKEKIRAIYANPAIPWTEKHQKIGELIETMPPEVQKMLPPRPPWAPHPTPNNGFPRTPPPGFEKILPKPVYNQLLKIHQDPNTNVDEKAQKIDEIMRSLKQEILNALPLPPGFEKLSADNIKEAKAIFTDKTLNYREKDKKVAEFVKNLPKDQRRLLRPPLPSALAQLPDDKREEIEDIFEDPSLDHKARNEKFWAVINSLPNEQKMHVQDAFMRPPPVLVPPPQRRR